MAQRFDRHTAAADRPRTREDGSRPRRLVGVALVTLLAGCHAQGAGDARKALAAIESGRVKADLQKYFDARRECASVLGADGGILHAARGDKMAAALRQAGLIVAVPDDHGDGTESFRPAPAAERWFDQDSTGYRLCYAKRKVASVLFIPGRVRPYVRYTFVLGDLAPWTRQPVLRAAAPQLRAVASGIEILGAESLPVESGKVDTSSVQDTWTNPTLFEFGMNFRDGITENSSEAGSSSPATVQ